MGRVLVMMLLGPVGWVFMFGAIPLAAFLYGWHLGQGYFPGEDERWKAASFGLAATGTMVVISLVLFRIVDNAVGSLSGDFAAFRRGGKAPMEPCEACGRPMDVYDYACRACGHVAPVATTKRR
jgi:hypothetical protein